jgi:hypothetical protein
MCWAARSGVATCTCSCLINHVDCFVYICPSICYQASWYTSLVPRSLPTYVGPVDGATEIIYGHTLTVSWVVHIKLLVILNALRKGLRLLIAFYGLFKICNVWISFETFCLLTTTSLTRETRPPPPSSLFSELLIYERVSDRFISRRVVCRSSDVAYNLTDSSLVTVAICF